MIANLGQLAPWLAPYARALVAVAPNAGARSVRITSVYRSLTEQAQLYANRASNPYPVAPPGRSWHNYRRAWDMVTEPYGALYTLGPWWRQMGGTWSESDPIHFQA